MSNNNVSDDESMDLDLNQEPINQPVESFSRFGSMINELETAHGRIYERIRQLEAVTARDRQRQLWREARNSVEYTYVPTEQLDSTNVNVEGSENRVKGFKRSAHLVAKALEMDNIEVKKVDKEGGSFYDCNICLEMAKEPVLTCCGHMYCWVCFYKLPYVDSTAKECPVCKGEVIDTHIIPIFGNGNSTHVEETETDRDRDTESSFKIPPRPKAQRVESIRQQRVSRGNSHIPVAEALRRIRSSFGGNIINNEDNNNNNNNTAQMVESSSNQFSRVLSESAASLSTISSNLDNAERLVDNLETYLLLRRRVHLLPTDPLTSVNYNTSNSAADVADIPSSSTIPVDDDDVDVPEAVLENRSSRRRNRVAFPQSRRRRMN